MGFDTEFVSEDTYRPELSLIQVNADNEIALIVTIRTLPVVHVWLCTLRWGLVVSSGLDLASMASHRSLVRRSSSALESLA